ncbi:MAG: hypothetical protein BHW52_02485 [Ruminococcus sp. 37_24]|jgi:hypothetical protein|nr:MAG: hypothetical protein BHW52_02485 [Ruminococcus sp. 37_24]DAZ78514.1 MAG TPA: SH3 domain protein [Caudoviricetes sp.]
MAKYTQSQMNILIKIIAAVETGGQIYGQARYNDYTPAYANCSNETSCTIGAFQEYGNLAKGLLQEILNTYPSTFRKYDNAGIESDLKRTSWTGYNCYSPARGSAKAKAIQAIISSSDGIKVQNSRVQKQMESHIAFAQKQGVSDVDALFMCANFIHQGGQSACTRILKKTQKPYTLDHLYAACKTDTGNQVGAYKTRQQKVYGWLKEKISNKNTSNNNSQGSDNMSNNIIQNIINDAVSFAVGIANDNSHGYSQAVRSLYNITNPKSYDCSSLCCTSYYYAFLKNGLTAQANYLKSHCSYTGNMLNMLNVGFEIVARNQTAHAQMQKGDLELNVTHHVAMAIDRDNIVHARSSEGTTNTIDDSGNEIRTQGWYNYSHGWDYRIRFTGKGLNLSNVKPSTTTYNKWVGAATKDDTDVFANPTGTSKLSTYPKLNKGNLVDVIGVSGTRYQVKIADKFVGYVEKTNIKDPNAVVTKPSASTNTSTSKPVTTTKKYPFVGEVTASELNVRTGAGTNYDKLSSYPILKKGNLVDVLKAKKDTSGNKWYQIRIADKYTGYVSAKYIKKK